MIPQYEFRCGSSNTAYDLRLYQSSELHKVKFDDIVTSIHCYLGDLGIDCDVTTL